MLLAGGTGTAVGVLVGVGLGVVGVGEGVGVLVLVRVGRLASSPEPVDSAVAPLTWRGSGDEIPQCWPRAPHTNNHALMQMISRIHLFPSGAILLAGGMTEGGGDLTCMDP